MRPVFILGMVLGGVVALEPSGKESKPLSPVEAIKRVNEKVTVQMLVKASKNRLEKRGEIYLDSEDDFHDPKNLAVVITKTGAAKLKEAKIDDPAVHFKGKTIRVSGKVILKDKRPRIEVDDAKRIQIVEKEK